MHCFKTYAFFAAHHKKLNKLYLYTFSDEHVAHLTLISGNIRFMRILMGFPLGPSNDSGGFQLYVSSTLGNEADVII